jgi:hypothetical protein
MPMPVMPIQKNSGCPSGYHTEVNLCVPGSNAKAALPKNGSCPSGYHTEGNYYVEN